MVYILGTKSVFDVLNQKHRALHQDKMCWGWKRKGKSKGQRKRESDQA